MVVGDISDSFSMLHHKVSRGLWGRRCTFGCKTLGARLWGQAARHDARVMALVEQARETRPTACSQSCRARMDPRTDSALTSQLVATAQRGAAGTRVCCVVLC
jgi:hypothetical protein